MTELSLKSKPSISQRSQFKEDTVENVIAKYTPFLYYDVYGDTNDPASLSFESILVGHCGQVARTARVPRRCQ